MNALVHCSCGFSFSMRESEIGEATDPDEDLVTVSCPRCLRDIDPWARIASNASDRAEIIVRRGKGQREVFDS